MVDVQPSFKMTESMIKTVTTESFSVAFFVTLSH